MRPITAIHIRKIIFTGITAIAFIIALSFLHGCKGTTPPKQPPQKKEAPPAKAQLKAPHDGAKLFLSQAQFIYEKDESGKSRPIPGPARLIILNYENNQWNKSILEDPESNVFHKAAWFTPPEGDPGILTIGATQAFLKIWHKKDGQWVGTSLWNPQFGGKFDRLRDFEVGDVNGDGIDDIVIATHDQGVIAVATWKDGKYDIQELCRKPETFVHEIELGDIDGDGIDEIFTTPSKPNKLDGSVQPGEIAMWEYDGGKWVGKEVELLKSRHAKEILCVTLNSEKSPVLFASLEGERIGGGEDAGDTTRIRMYRYIDQAFKPTDIASLPGHLCRFLTYGDTDGDGAKELIASTKNSGIWKLSPGSEGVDGTWAKVLVATGTSGFEHATYLADLNQDNVQEIYVASDDQREMRAYWFNGKGYSAEIITPLKDNTITFNITAL